MQENSLLFASSIPFLPFFCHEQKSSRDFNLPNTGNHPRASQTVLQEFLHSESRSNWLLNKEHSNCRHTSGSECTAPLHSELGRRGQCKGHVKARPCPAGQDCPCYPWALPAWLQGHSWLSPGKAGTAGREVFGCVQDVSNVPSCSCASAPSQSTEVNYSPVSSKESLCREAHLLPTPVGHMLNFQQEL